MQFPSDDRNFGGAQQQVATAPSEQRSGKRFQKQAVSVALFFCTLLQFRHSSAWTVAEVLHVWHFLHSR